MTTPSVNIQGLWLEVAAQLQHFLADVDFTHKLHLAFGEAVAQPLAIDLIQGLIEGEGRPSIEVRSSAEINGANGAFAVATNKIYLAEELLLGFDGRADAEAIVSVLLEEVGHFIDAQLNREDASGDEGAIFSALVRGQALGPTQLTALQAENDQATVVLDGQTVEIEQAGLSITETTTPKGYLVDDTTPGNLLNLGWVVAGNGDINGDGVSDFVVSARGGANNAGEIYVIFGNGLNPFATEVVTLNSLFSPQVSIALGDINGDGKDDIIIGDSSANTGTFEGSTYVVFGGSHEVIATDVTTLNGTNGFTIVDNDGGLNLPDLLGWSVSAGDINGDGFDDVLIGDPFNGEVTVVFGQNASSFPVIFNISTASSPDEALTFTGPIGSQIGFSVASGKIINGDTAEDLIIGAPFAGNGEIYVVLGNVNHSIPTAPSSAPSQGLSLSLTTTTPAFAPPSSAPDQGLSLSPTTTIISPPPSSTPGQGLTFASTTPGGALGAKVASIGDINGDGYGDLGVTEPGGSATQRTFVVFGGLSLPTTLDTNAITSGSGATGFYIDGLNGDDVQFEAISGAGDVNNDGIDDFLIAEAFSDTNGTDSGQVYVIYGKTGGFGSSLDLGSLGINDGWSLEIDGVAANDLTGYSISAAGDINDDGYDDFLVGAPGANNGDGSIYTIFGQPTDQPLPETTVDFLPYHIYRNKPDLQKRLIGENHKFVVTFDNIASSPGNIGYKPFFDLFLDTTGEDGDGEGPEQEDGFDKTFGTDGIVVRALSDYDFSFKDDGSVDGVHTLEYLNALNGGIETATIYQQSGELWVGHPYSGPINLTSTTDLPNGIGVGDTLYVVPLLTDSFAPDQEPLTFEVETRISQLADYQQPLTVATRGGFRTGANAIFDGSPLDPVFDNTVTENSLEPQLFRVQKLFTDGFDQNHNSARHEQIITGENFGGRYNIYVDVASGQTIETLNIEDHLPDALEFVALTSTNALSHNYSTPGEPGGTVTAQFGNITGGSGIDSFLHFEVEIGLQDENGNDALDPNTADDQIADNDAFVTAAKWDPLDGRDPTLSNLTEDQGDIDSRVTELAIGVRNNRAIVADNKAPGLSPGDVIEYTLDFAVSDYFAFEDVIINDIFSDGQVFDNSFTPTFTVNEHDGTLAGNFALDNYSVTNPGSSGSIQFNITDQLVTSGGDSKLLGGRVDSAGGYTTGTFGATTGTLKFRTIIPEDFATAFPSGDSSVDNGDILRNHATITGNILDVDSLAPTGFNESDDDALWMRLPRGKYADFDVSIYAINGTSGGEDGVVAAGDQVTYRIQYTLPFADIEDLNFTSELPFPVFDVADLDTSQIYAPGLGGLNKISYGPTDTLHTFSALNPGGSITPNLAINGQNNALTIDYGDFDDPTSANPVTIDLLYTLEVGNQATGNNQILTNIVYEREGSTNLGGRLFYKFATLDLAQPELEIQKGVVATSESQAIFSEFFPVISGSPTIEFSVPGTPGTRFSGIINSNILDTTNYFNSDITADLSNLTGNNGQTDLVTYAIVVENIGPSPTGAYDVLIQDILPTGYDNSDVTNLSVTDGSGTPVAFNGNLFGSGIELIDGPTGAISGFNATNGDNVVVITYDLEIDEGLAPETVLTNTAVLQEYSASEGGAKFLSGPQTLEDETQVKTQPYLQEQFTDFLDGVADGIENSPSAEINLAGQTFDGFNYLGNNDLTYQGTLERTVRGVTEIIPLDPSHPKNPFANIDLPNLEFEFKPALSGILAASYTVNVQFSDLDPTNNSGGADFDVEDSFDFQANFFGNVINNYMVYANVFFDANGNRIQDPGEAVAITDKNGKFSIATDLFAFDNNNNGILDPSEGQFVAINGINTATGQPLSVPLIATSDASFVSPLTTLTAGLMAQGHTANQANTLLTDAFGINNSISLGQFDPIAATHNGSAYGVETYLAHTQVQITLGLSHSLFQGATNGGSTIIDNVIAAVVDQIEADSTLDPTNTTQLESILTQAAADLGIDIASDISGAAQIIAAANQAVAEVDPNLPATERETAFAQIEKVALGETSQDLQAVGAGTKSISDAITENTGAALETQINGAEVFSADPTDISLSSDTVVSGLAIGTEVGIFSTVDPNGSNAPGETHTYHFVPTLDANDNNLFEIDGNRLLTKQSFDHTVQSSFNIEVFSSDGNGGIHAEQLTITIAPPIPDNIIDGTSSRETLTGTNGRDIITGFKGRDTLIGGPGNDDFVYTSMADAWDRIRDFEVGSDRIVFTQLLDGLGYSGIDPIADHYIKFNSRGNGTMVQIDPDGDGGARARSLVYVENVALTEHNANSFVF
jgi:hypothetical protein